MVDSSRGDDCGEKSTSPLSDHGLFTRAKPTSSPILQKDRRQKSGNDLWRAAESEHILSALLVLLQPVL